MNFDKELDARGLNCPLPILRTKKALTDMSSGQVLKVLATDPGAVKDFQTFSRQTGHQLVSHDEANKEFTFFIEEEVKAVWLLGLGLASAVHAQATFSVKVMTPETALKAAQAALKSCRERGFQATVAVVDRMGVVQVLLRDRFAGPHTPDMATAKAYTAASLRTNTTELAEASQPGRPASGIRHRPGIAAVGGGMLIEAGGSLLGAIGVSGAPGGREDDACAAAGIAAIREDIEL